MGTPRARSMIITAILVPAIAFGQIGGGGSTPGISPQAGQPFPWEGGLQVSPWSTVNLFNGNLITRIPFTSWDDVGPGINFAFFHNSAEPEITITQGQLGIPFGPGWSMADAGFLVIDLPNSEVHVVEDTGLMKTYAEGANDTWLPPTGVHDELEHDAVADQWTLTRKNQWRRVFDATGHLLYEYDANQQDFGVLGVGLRKAMTWADACDPENPGPESCWYHIVDVNGRYVYLKYFVDENGRFYDVTTSTGEWWTVRLDSSYRPTRIVVGHENDATIEIAYVNGTDRIHTITDKEGKVWEYEYHATGDHAGKLWKVHDPAINTTQYHQTFTYSVSAAGYKTTYVDRRSNTWQFLSYSWGPEGDQGPRDKDQAVPIRRRVQPQLLQERAE